MTWGYGATVARLTPDQTVGRSNRSGLNHFYQSFVFTFLFKISFALAIDTLAEWLRRRPAKPVGSAREGSNPSGVEDDLSDCDV